MTNDEMIQTLLAMAKVQDGYAKNATDPGLKLIHKANANAQREVAAVITDMTAKFDRLEAAAIRLKAVLDQNDTKGPISDVAMMFCWMAAQDVRAALAPTAPTGWVRKEAAPRLQDKIDRAVAEAADGVEQVKKEVG